MTHDLSHENNFKPWLDNYLNKANIGVVENDNNPNIGGVEKLDNINKEVLEIIDKFSTNIVDEE